MLARSIPAKVTASSTRYSAKTRTQHPTGGKIRAWCAREPTGFMDRVGRVPSAGLSPVKRAAALDGLRARAVVCARCPELVRARTQVVFGTGPADADLLLVGEAPDLAEDRDGVLVPGAAGRLLDEVLASIGRSREDVAIVTVVKCRTPENRSPLRTEIEHCQDYLLGQIALVAPTVVCPLGTFATRLLRGENTPVRKLRGSAEVRTLGTRAVRLYPLLHPAAALYTPAGVEQLRADVAGIPGLLRLGPPEQPAPAPEPPAEHAPAPTAPDPGPPEPPEPEHPQLGLF